MESVFDITNEAKRDYLIDLFKKRTIMNTERDVHFAFEIYGRETVIDMVASDCIAFLLGDRTITQAEAQFEVCKDPDTVIACLFGGDDPSKYLREKIEALIDELIADYEVQL